MTNNLIDTDQALADLLKELTTLKSATQQLNTAGQMASDTIDAAERVTVMSDQIMQNSTEQLNMSAEQAALTQERMAEVIAEQKSFAEDMQRFIQSELQPQLAKYQRTANINRWFLIVILLLLAWSILGNN